MKKGQNKDNEKRRNEIVKNEEKAFFYLIQ